MNLKKYALLLCTVSLGAYSLPIDWSGSLGFDATTIKDARGQGSCSVAAPANTDSQCINDDNTDARFQTMLLKLNPTLIVNDSTSIKGELSTGSIRGGFLQEDQETNTSGAYFSANEGSSTLNINQLYAELYADTAIYKIGKFSKGFGLGAVINSGDKSWDRFFSAYSGVEANFRLGNLTFVPTYAKISTGNGPGSTAISPSGKYDASETSFEVSYSNAINGLDAGALYAKRKVEIQSDLYASGVSQKVTLIDLFVKKTWDKFSVALEAPIMSGQVGKTYTENSTGSLNGIEQEFDAKAYIFESTYTPSNKWSFGLNAGLISGDSGADSDFEGMYLHSNYQLANIMFRYDLNGFQDSGSNPFNSSMRNTTYLNLYTDYKTINWKWTLSLLMAKADQVAERGSEFFNHDKKSYSTTSAAEDQDNDLGYEIDLGFEYEWNPQIHISGFIGYYFVGDYYSFDNNPSTSIDTSDIVSSGMRISVNF